VTFPATKEPGYTKKFLGEAGNFIWTTGPAKTPELFEKGTPLFVYE